LRRLAECRHALLEGRQGQYHLTEAGRDVLGARADHIHLNGINRCLGAVHLLGNGVLWRWDERARRLVRRYDRLAFAGAF